MPLDLTRYRVLCRCGTLAEGVRQAKPQIVSCRQCRARLFIYPTGHPEPPAPPRPPLPWRGPVMAAGITLLLLALALLIGWPWLMRPRVTVSLEDQRRHIEEARTHLTRGRFRLASTLLAEHPLESLPADEARSAQQLRRQADLLAQLSLVSLTEIVQQARFVRDPREWAAQWADHRDRAILFDDVLRRDPHGRPVFARLVLMADDELLRVALEDLRLLQELPLEETRVIFGARLAACERETGGHWVIRLAPDSGVLLTEREALEAASAVDLGPDLPEVLARQTGWLAGRGR